MCAISATCVKILRVNSSSKETVHVGSHQLLNLLFLVRDLCCTGWIRRNRKWGDYQKSGMQNADRNSCSFVLQELGRRDWLISQPHILLWIAEALQCMNLLISTSRDLDGFALFCELFTVLCSESGQMDRTHWVRRICWENSRRQETEYADLDCVSIGNFHRC